LDRFFFDGFQERFLLAFRFFRSRWSAASHQGSTLCVINIVKPCRLAPKKSVVFLYYHTFPATRSSPELSLLLIHSYSHRMLGIFPSYETWPQSAWDWTVATLCGGTNFWRLCK
jgi:hypothetical protein